MNKYILPLETRKNIVLTQIIEQQTILYRNDLENFGFKKDNNRHKQTEVATNNEMLREKLDLLFEELERLNAEDQTGSGTSEPRPTV